MSYTETIRKLSASLKATYENTIFSHPGDVGDSREKELIDYLTRVMAHKYGFLSGEVFDHSGTNSGQIDIIIYDNVFSTVFTDGTEKIFAPVESTYGVISVKSLMNTSKLDHAIEGLSKYNSLERPIIETGTIQFTPDLGVTLGGALKMSKSSSQQNINCIFAFDTNIATDTILQKVADSGFVDLLVIPGKICVIGRHRKEFGLSAGENKFENVAIQNDNSIGLFTLLLQIYLSSNSLVAVDTQKLLLGLLESSASILKYNGTLVKDIKQAD